MIDNIFVENINHSDQGIPVTDGNDHYPVFTFIGFLMKLKYIFWTVFTVWKISELFFNLMMKQTGLKYTASLKQRSLSVLFIRNWWICLTHWDRDKLDAISQTTFSSEFYWTKIFGLRFKINWSLFLRVQLTIFQHWFRYWLGAVQATSHYLNQCSLVYRRIYASLGLNELINSSPNQCKKEISL